jgi:uncharacterized protein
MNPFKYGQVVSAESFCPRFALTKQVMEFIKAGQNIILQGERRTGKTSLIYEVSRLLKKYAVLYIDLLEVKDMDDICKRMVKAIISLERQAGFLEKIMRILAHLRPVMSVDSLTGEPSISLEAIAPLRPDSINSILDLIADIGKHKALIVVFDEFQDILNLAAAREVMAVLRSKIQFHNKIPYVFAGSIRNKMVDIFTNPESPFFKSAIPIEVGAIEREQFRGFLKNNFLLGERTVDDEVLDVGFGITGDLPGDVQQYCGALWDVTNEKTHIDKQYIPEVMRLIFSREMKGYEAVLVQVTGQQLRCLVGLARLGGGAPYSAAFLRGVGIAVSSSVKKALQRLEQLKVVYHYGGEYKFVNPFFKAWLLWKDW